MSIVHNLRCLIKQSHIFNYNVLNRDAWVAKQAATVAQGSLLLDAGAGSCPYRHLFSHCKYKAQDFTSLEGERLSSGEYEQIDL